MNPSLLEAGLVVGGILLAGVGGILGVAGLRLRQRLRREPFHREGDALAAYLPGCGAALWALGLLVAVAGGWLWSRS